MIEAIIAFCLVGTADGSMTSRCWLSEEDVLFKNKTACREYAEMREIEVTAMLVEKYDKAAVVSVVCGSATNT